MGRGKAISEFERGQVKALHHEGVSKQKIAKALKRTVGLVTNCLKRGPDLAPGVSTGRKVKHSDATARLIRSKASNTTASASRLKEDLNLDMSERSVSRVLNTSEHLQYSKMALRPQLKVADKAARLQWAHDRMAWKEQWSRVIFSDEKKFNFDGPDGWDYYWHDLRKQKKIFAKRNFGGGSVMMWVGLSRDYKAQMYLIDGNLDSAQYQTLLNTVMLPLHVQVAAKYRDGAIFQQDNAKPHTARATQNWLQEHGIAVLPWISRSPDLNITENLFGIICRDVYKDCKHYNSQPELRDAIVLAWQNISPEVIGKLVDSMPERVFEVINKNGGYTRF
jgi:transposase